MRTIPWSLFNGTTEELVARIDEFKNALAAHAKTVGVPAPREEDFIEHLTRTGEAFEVEPPPPPPPSAAEIAAAELEAKRAAALFAVQRTEIESEIAAHRVRQDQILALAMGDPNAPQEVKDYVAAKANTETDTSPV